MELAWTCTEKKRYHFHCQTIVSTTVGIITAKEEDGDQRTLRQDSENRSARMA